MADIIRGHGASEVLIACCDRLLEAQAEFEERGREAYANTPEDVRKTAYPRVIESVGKSSQQDRWWALAWLDAWDRDHPRGAARVHPGG